MRLKQFQDMGLGEEGGLRLKDYYVAIRLPLVVAILYLIDEELFFDSFYSFWLLFVWGVREPIETDWFATT